MATTINHNERQILKTTSFTDETTTLTIADTSRLANPMYVQTPERLWMGMSIYGPDNFDELTMGLPFEEINLDGYGSVVPWDITMHQTAIRQMMGNYSTREIYVYAKGLKYNEYYIHWQKCTVTLINAGALPIYTSGPSYTIDDSLTKTLSGNSNTIIRYVTDVTITFNAEAQKEAAIYGYTVRNGSQTEYKAVLYNPTTVSGSASFTNCDSALFTTVVEDNRGYSANSSVEVPYFIEYFSPTCRIKAQAPSATGGSTAITAEGIAFNGSFGSKTNTITVQCRFRTVNGTWSSWLTMSATRNGTEYNASTAITGLDYQETYIFEGRIVDQVTTVTSAQVSAKSEPVFDWSEEDFNFNVPVNITDATFNINDETILRHTGATTNNTVLSASGGHIYIRPQGTSEPDGEVKITPQGNVELKGNLILTDSDIIVAGVAFSTIVAKLQSIGLLD